jgi:cell division protein FtsA
MNLGSLLIDIGGSSTSFSVILEGKLIHIGNSPIGGVHITKDISTILNISFELAEKIKTLNSSLLISSIEERETIRLKNSQNSDIQELISISRLELREIIESRLEEIFESVKIQLQKSGMPVYMISNIAITGGVASIVGVDKLASKIFEKNVRIGYPNKLGLTNLEILNTTHSCSLGMLSFLQNLHLKEKIKDGFESKNSWFRRLLEKLV